MPLLILEPRQALEAIILFIGNTAKSSGSPSSCWCLFQAGLQFVNWGNRKIIQDKHHGLIHFKVVAYLFRILEEQISGFSSTFRLFIAQDFFQSADNSNRFSWIWFNLKELFSLFLVQEEVTGKCRINPFFVFKKSIDLSLLKKIFWNNWRRIRFTDRSVLNLHGK